MWRSVHSRMAGTAVLGVVVLIGVLTSCGDDGGDDEADGGGSSGDIEVVMGDVPSIVSLRDITCAIADDGRQLVASGVVESVGDTTHYVDIDVRFVDGDDVRVELSSDSVSDLQVGEAARWAATTYSDDAEDVRRCEVSATVG